METTPTEKLPPVLDACCGSRMFWFDKSDPRALFVDRRRETLIDHTGPKPASIVVNPDVLANFKALPFQDNSFSLVVFDPPHTWCGPNGRTIKKYGSLPPDWREEISAGFRECFRVLCPLGTLIFKWNEHRVKLSTVLSLTDQKPLFGQKIGNTKTHWIVFHKQEMETLEKEKLLACPFCGKQPKIICGDFYESPHKRWMIGCECASDLWFPNREDAENKWNSRKA